MNPLARYALSVLLGEDGDSMPPFADAVYYGAVEDAPPDASFVMVPSDFFSEEVYGTDATMPELPLQEIEGVPLLFGEPKVERRESPHGTKRLVVHADLIASAFFLLTRYEEMLRREVRDSHGRFPGRESLPFRAGFLQRPVVDEYARLLRGWLREAGIDATEPLREFGVVLTHDVDCISFFQRSVSSFQKLRRTLIWCPWVLLLYPFWRLGLLRDPFDTFDWILAQDDELITRLGPKRAEMIYFFKGLPKGTFDDSCVRCYHLGESKVGKLLQKLQQRGAIIGLHPSYLAGSDPSLLPQERRRLESAIGSEIHRSRHHYLRWLEPEQVEAIEAADITDDYTLGYADQVGFRLGVCRPVRFFDPVRKQLSRVTVHPQAVMDTTLDAKQYMGLSSNDAEETILRLVRQVKQHRGELVLLWHNESFAFAKRRERYRTVVKNITKKRPFELQVTRGLRQVAPSTFQADNISGKRI